MLIQRLIFLKLKQNFKLEHCSEFDDLINLQLESRPVDVEMLQLLYDIFETEIPANLIRGYTLLPSKGLPKTKMRNIELNTSIKREI